jgi:hypothetical protein
MITWLKPGVNGINLQGKDGPCCLLNGPDLALVVAPVSVARPTIFKWSVKEHRLAEFVP